ncbi:sterol desaturase family protein [Hymenobacter actinosclerus]|uniref:Sterol desaturase/sphingolipid hydroxylase, fatty acid hydroxylase superfamily n=1 Tax=Hymenobacter actinosclerus TaxID=82805 RepID=A0A1I0I890_9BACT|nr:sterol desaturase family protein [Hymenobacter actinosclerus]SET92057.1 Sterol desaturase/sphingolipid hydroxylase, fatty acid hydroxylase superfamily [Hymenobacter actinosclerus]
MNTVPETAEMNAPLVTPVKTPDAIKPKHKGSARLFENPVLERLTHTHIAGPLTIFFLVAAVSLYYSLSRGLLTGLSAFGLFLGGWLLFTLAEYLMHRYVYHIDTSTPARAKFQYTMHGVHHEFPKDKTRLAMPPILTVFVASLLFFIFRFTFGNAGFGILAGFVFGYALYLFVHYALHVYAPPKNFLKFWWHHHAMHHYKQEEIAFGVSTTLWDHIVGTMPAKKGK